MMPKQTQISLRVTKEQKKEIIDKAKILIEVIDGKSYDKGEAIIRIHEKFLEDNSSREAMQKRHDKLLAGQLSSLSNNRRE